MEKNPEREQITMCEWLDKVEARGEARGITIGEVRGEARSKKEYEAKLAEMQAELDKYKAMATLKS